MRWCMNRCDLAEGFWGMGVGSTELVYVLRLIHHWGYIHGG
jgi:hypothetical protein